MCFLIFNMDKGVIFVLDEKNITLFEFEVKNKVLYLKITQSVSFFTTFASSNNSNFVL